MNKLTALKPLKTNYLFLCLVSSLIIVCCQKQPSALSTYQAYTSQELDSWQSIIKDEQLPVKERLSTWVNYADITSVYNNIYSNQSAEERQNLLANLISQISPEDHSNKILGQYLAGELHWKNGNTKVATNFFETLENMVDSLWPTYPDKRMIYHYLGILNGELGKPVLAKEYTLKCIQECERVQDDYLLGLAYWNIAIHYGNLEDYDQEVTYLDKAMKLAKKLDYTYLKVNLLATKSNNFHDRGKVEKADSLYQLTIAACKDPDLAFVRHLALLNYGNLMLHKENYEQAYGLLKQCKSYAQQIGNNFLLTASNSQLAAFFIATNQLEGLAPFIEQTAKQQEELGLQHERVESIRQLSFYHQKKKNYPQALKYYQQYHDIYKKLKKSDHLTLMAQSATAIQEQITRNKQRLIQGLYAGLALLSLFLFFAINSYHQKKKSNQEIAFQKGQLEQINLSKDRMLSIIAHDLKKPMISFRGITEKVNYLLSKQDYPRLLALGKDIDKETFLLTALVDNLLKWAMLQKNVLFNSPTKVHLGTTVDQVFKLFQATAQHKKVTLNNHIAPSHEVIVDENVLRTILRNLVDNAVKFSPPNGEVHITSILTDKGVQISVQDKGIGIPPEKLKRLFLLQKEKSTKGTRGELGAGLGLHLVKELTNLCNGQIKVISQLGIGTSFEIYLPRIY